MCSIAYVQKQIEQPSTQPRRGKHRIGAIDIGKSFSRFSFSVASAVRSEMQLT